MTSIVLKPTRSPDLYALSLRTHDAGGVDYSTLAILEKDDAAAIAGGHSFIFFHFNSDELEKGIEKHPLIIERVPDREPGTRAWQMRIGNRVSSRVDAKDGIRKTIRLDDAAVHELSENARVLFADGEPDWVLREVEILEDRALALEQEALRARERAQQARLSWEDRMALPAHDQDMELQS